MSTVVAALVVFVVFGLMSMAGLGAATLFIPLFYYSGMPLPEAISTGLLLNVVSLGATIPVHVRARTINFGLAAPIALMAALLAPIGAAVSGSADRDVLLVLFACALVASSMMMLFYRPAAPWNVARPVEVATGVTVGGVVGFLAGLIGVGGGAFVLPVFHGIGLDARKASGTTAVVALASSIAAFIARASFSDLDYTFTVVLMVAAGLGSLAASRFSTKRLSEKGLKQVVAAILILIAVRIVWDLVR